MIYYICDNENSVFESQVVELLKVHERHAKVRLLLFTKRRDEYLPNLGEIDCVKITYMPLVFPFFLLSIIPLIRHLSNYSADDVIHVRGERYGALVVLIGWLTRKKFNLVIDVRGLGLEEHLIYGSGAVITKVLRSLSYKIIRKIVSGSSAKFSYVSRTLARVLGDLGYDNSKHSVVHCLASQRFVFDLQERNAMRRRLSISSDQLVVIFTSAGSAKWNTTAKLEQYIHSFPNVIFINLSKNKINSANVINKFVHLDEVSKYLSCADVGIIYRDKNIVNRVSCPVKLMEYYSNGLPVFHNNVINVTEELNHILNLEECEFQEILELGNNRQISIESRKNRSKLFYQKSGIEASSRVYCDLYVS